MRRAKTWHGLYSKEAPALRRAVRAIRSASGGLRKASAEGPAPEE